MGPRSDPDRCGKSRPPTGIRSPNRPARSSVAIPTELPGPLEDEYLCLFMEADALVILKVNLLAPELFF